MTEGKTTVVIFFQTLAQIAASRHFRSLQLPQDQAPPMESYVTLMCYDIWKVFRTITLTHPTNFVSVKIAINLFPGDQDGPDPQVPVPFTQLKTDVCGHLEGVPDYHSYTSH